MKPDSCKVERNMYKDLLKFRSSIDVWTCEQGISWVSVSVQMMQKNKEHNDRGAFVYFCWTKRCEINKASNTAFTFMKHRQVIC